MDSVALFEALQAVAIDLHARWKLHRDLYASTPERIDLLNQSASSFFAIVQHLTIDDIIMRISRLLDPAKTSGQDNLTLDRLLKGLDPKPTPAVEARLADIRAKLTDAWSNPKLHRHKRLAHNDLRTMTKVAPLPQLTLGDIDTTLGLLREFLDEVQRHLKGATTEYKESSFDIGGVWKLVALLQFATESKLKDPDGWRAVRRAVTSAGVKRATAKGKSQIEDE
jgi:hypothetical protein